MVSFFAFLLFRPFCPANLPASLSVGLLASLSIVKRACQLALEFNRLSNLFDRLAFQPPCNISLLCVLRQQGSRKARRPANQECRKASRLGMGRPTG
ncbi:putative ubiquitin-protein ligase [Sesbania bispinosa]|nr:putative ubiquitin-protein ligase [Sesbania bispinosa]